jgi:hypothetical protein
MRFLGGEKEMSYSVDLRKRVLKYVEEIRLEPKEAYSQELYKQIGRN